MYKQEVFNEQQRLVSTYTKVSTCQKQQSLKTMAASKKTKTKNISPVNGFSTMYVLG